VVIVDYPAGGDGAVLITANDPAALAARVLKYQREVHQLTLADVAKKLGASSLNSYAAYEQGKREPSLSKMAELLSVVAPEMALTIGPRTPAVAKQRPVRAAKKTAG
jgi:transcriptional regulator with XRE-family HTH domain